MSGLRISLSELHRIFQTMGLGYAILALILRDSLDYVPVLPKLRKSTAITTTTVNTETLRCEHVVHRVMWKRWIDSAVRRNFENCRKAHPTAPLFLNDDSGISTTPPSSLTAQGSAVVAGAGVGKPTERKEKKDKKDAPIRSVSVSTSATGAIGGSSSTIGDIVNNDNGVKLLKTTIVSADGTVKEKTLKIKPPIVKGPMDLDKHCGVSLESGQTCGRSITCKIHSVSSKRAVPGRSQHYDLLVSEYQTKNRALAANGGLDGRKQGGGIGGSAQQQQQQLQQLMHLGPLRVPSEQDAAVLFEGIKYHQPQPIATVSGTGVSGFSLGGLMNAINTRSVRYMLREIREKRLAVGGN
ncbi:hypothetical protein HK100_006466 [Physocladia obscura]|uniref:SCA7 domain-containing protein n=1 Tax=Physocladia obscura TaxID=109957 RepID=A0AAD5TA94_9FUNG|nr:hypothetical protein HK100_006466 [Physocladia obscura]